MTTQGGQQDADASSKNEALHGRVALVTGAGGGIGREIVLALADAGCSVVGSDLSTDRIDEIASVSRSTGVIRSVAGDLSTVAGVDEVIDGAQQLFGPIDVLVNNAAILYKAPAVDLDMDVWDRVFNINVRAVVRASQLVVPGMCERGFGRIVNVSSIVGYIPRKGLAAYGAAKAAVSQFTRVLALESAEYGVTANVVAPGPTATDIGAVATAGDQPRRFDRAVHGTPEDFRPGIPIGRIIEPGEQARAVLFLALPGSAGITGQTIHVNGGQHMT